MISDITEQKKTETQLKRFFDISRDMFCIAGTDGYFKQINPAFENRIGFQLPGDTQQTFSGNDPSGRQG